MDNIAVRRTVEVGQKLEKWEACLRDIDPLIAQALRVQERVYFRLTYRSISMYVLITELDTG